MKKNLITLVGLLLVSLMFTACQPATTPGKPAGSSARKTIVVTYSVLALRCKRPGRRQGHSHRGHAERPGPT